MECVRNKIYAKINDINFYNTFKNHIEQHFLLCSYQLKYIRHSIKHSPIFITTLSHKYSIYY
jgi:hypothetical protein